MLLSCHALGSGNVYQNGERTVIGKLHGICHTFLMFSVVECDMYLLSLLESQLYYICMLLNKENMNNYCKMFGASIFLL